MVSPEMVEEGGPIGIVKISKEVVVDKSPFYATIIIKEKQCQTTIGPMAYR